MNPRGLTHIVVVVVIVVVCVIGVGTCEVLPPGQCVIYWLMYQCEVDHKGREDDDILSRNAPQKRYWGRSMRLGV